MLDPIQRTINNNRRQIKEDRRVMERRAGLVIETRRQGDRRQAKFIKRLLRTFYEMGNIKALNELRDGTRHLTDEV